MVTDHITYVKPLMVRKKLIRHFKYGVPQSPHNKSDSQLPASPKNQYLVIGR